MNRTRLIFIAALAGLLGGCAEPDEYPLARKDAYAKLMAVRIAASADGPFHRLETTISGNGGTEVTYDASGPMARHVCRMDLAEIEPVRTKVKVTCEGGGAGDGAAAGMVHHLVRNRVIELVDATLKGRPFDPQLAEGSTAYRWPNDGVDGSYAKAASDAIKMDAKVHRDIAEIEKMDEQKQAEPASDFVDPAVGVEPVSE